MEATYDNVRECEAAGIESIIAYSPITDESFLIASEQFSAIYRGFSNRPLLDSKGNPFVLVISTREIEIIAIVEDIMEDYLALDRLHKRGYF